MFIRYMHGQGVRNLNLGNIQVQLCSLNHGGYNSSDKFNEVKQYDVASLSGRATVYNLTC